MPASSVNKKGGRKEPRTDHGAASGITSIKVFRRFMVRSPTDGSLDASQVTSLACYKAWLASRKQDTRHPEKAFQRTLTGHLTGMDGRTPFTKEEESAILEVLRRRQRWACFEHTKTRFGELGFRTKGYHERLEEEEVESSDEEEQDGAISSFSDSESMQPQSRSNYLSWQQSKRMKTESYGQQSEESAAEEESSTTLSKAQYSNDEDEEEEEEEEAMDEGMYAEQILEPGNPVIVSDFTKTANINYMIAGIVAIAKKLSNFAHMWTVLYRYGRMRLLGHGWTKAPTDEQADRLMQRLNQRYPGEYIVMIDVTQNNFEDRILRQNDIAVQYFGKISKQHGGFTQKRFLPKDTWAVLKAVVTAYAYPEQEISIRTQWLRNKGSGPAQWFDTNFIALSDHHVIVEHGRPADLPFNM